MSIFFKCDGGKIFFFSCGRFYSLVETPEQENIKNDYTIFKIHSNFIKYNIKVF